VASILKYIIGVNINKNIDITIINFRKTRDSFLCLIKNIIDSGMIMRSVSDLTKTSNDAIENAINVYLILLVNNNINVIENKKIVSGSVNPCIELSTSLGLNVNIIAPIIAYFVSTNFLHKKNIGIIVIDEIIIAIDLCI
tara:strand:+ start:694 stop:1113 length:420 start_codon:yes stop_codon:yes gene_type:complete